jgi:hypothetical protein
MEKNQISLQKVIEDIVKWVGPGDKKRVMIIPGDPSDFSNLTSELEREGIEYYQADTLNTPKTDYVVNLSLIKLT